MIINVDFIYPIGSIYFSVNSQNPSKWFGGTWVAWGTGRVPVGIDTSQTEFNSVEKTGGSKYMQKHQHTEYVNNGGGARYPFTLANGGGASTAGNFFSNNQIFSNYTGPQVLTGETGTGTSGNLQPYITCYMWKRTA